MKSFLTVRDTQRGSHSYMEKRRGRREIEVTRRRRGRIKRGKSKLTSNHFHICSPQSGSLRDVHGVTQRSGRKETEVAKLTPKTLTSSSGTTMIRMLGHLTLPQKSLRLSSFLLILFSSLLHLSLPFYLLPVLSYILPPLFYCWIPPECF